MHLTPRQLAARWRVSEKTLERWRHTGTGPSFLKIVGRILYPLTGIEAIEAKGTHLAKPGIYIDRVAASEKAEAPGEASA